MSFVEWSTDRIGIAEDGPWYGFVKYGRRQRACLQRSANGEPTTAVAWFTDLEAAEDVAELLGLHFTFHEAGS